MRFILLFIGAVLTVGLVGGAYYLGQKQSPTLPAVPAATPTRTETSTDPNITTFLSPDLGISFQYQKMQDKDEFTARAIGNKVYVYWANRPIEQGQYVEVFSKDKNDDLKTAVEKKILASYAKQDCFVTMGENPTTDQPIPANFVFARIDFPRPSGGNNEALVAAYKKCPAAYTAWGGIAYFAMDRTHPDKFVFFSIGQYYIGAGPNLAWQSTLKFL